MKRFVPIVFALAVLSTAAFAGPPLICEPYSIGGDPSLPWGANKGAWDDIDLKYNTDNLASDTLKLLDSGSSMLARMETLRRATVYAHKTPTAGMELENRLLARALTAEVKGQTTSIALFDAGYFVESMNQMARIWEPKAASDIDGYDLARRSLPALPDKLTAEFGLGLMQAEKSWPDDHIRRVIAGVQEGSPLAQNLMKHFRNQTFAEVKRKVTVDSASR